MEYIVALTKRKVAKVSEEDFNYLVSNEWTYTQQGYAVRTRKQRREYMHRIIMKRTGQKIPKGFYVDHINRDKLDNRRENLRIVDPTWSRYNEVTRANKSGMRGVHKSGKGWEATLRIYGKRYRKHFKTLLEAANCRRYFEDKFIRWN